MAFAVRVKSTDTVLFLRTRTASRSVGVGEAMADALVAHCTAQGCIGIDARALPGHRATKNFFEAHGFTARALVMHHVLHRR